MRNRNGLILLVVIAIFGSALFLLRGPANKPPQQVTMSPATAIQSSKTADEKPPAYRAPSVTDLKLREFVNRESTGNRTPLDFNERVPKLKNEQDISAVVAVLLDCQDEDPVRHEAAELLRRS